MKQISEKQIAKIIESECWKDLATLEQDGIPRRALVTMVALMAKQRVVGLSEEVAEEFRDRRDAVKLLSTSIEKLGRKVRALVPLDGEPRPASLNPVLAEAMNLYRHTADTLTRSAEIMRDHSGAMGRSLRSYGRKDQAIGRDVAMICAAILTFNKQFMCWDELSRVLAKAFFAAGIKKDFFPETLNRQAKRYIRRRPLWTEKEN
jgi:hypothetical protein